MPTAKLLRDCAVPLPPSIQSPQTANSVTAGTSSTTATTARKRRGGRGSAAATSLGGVRSVKLPTLAQETFRPVVRFSQRLERALYAVLYGGVGRTA